MYVSTKKRHFLDHLISPGSKDLEKKREDVDNIQVDVESGKDILLWTDGVVLVSH